MNTKITLTYEGQKYTLEYDRMAIKRLEANGFVLDDFMSRPLSNIELAFAGAFLKNHKNTPQTTIDKIFGACGNKNELTKTLVSMIQETYDSLLDDEDTKEGNVTWEVVDLSVKKDQK